MASTREVNSCPPGIARKTIPVGEPSREIEKRGTGEGCPDSIHSSRSEADATDWSPEFLLLRVFAGRLHQRDPGLDLLEEGAELVEKVLVEHGIGSFGMFRY
jgi:hypothetical protein